MTNDHYSICLVRKAKWDQKSYLDFQFHHEEQNMPILPNFNIENSSNGSYQSEK